MKNLSVKQRVSLQRRIDEVLKNRKETEKVLSIIDEFMGELGITEILTQDKASRQTKIVEEKLIQLGVPANVTGFRYLTLAIVEARENPECSDCMEAIYMTIAQKFNITSRAVSKMIQYAIDKCYQNQTKEYRKLFPENNRPTNSQFIAKVKIRIH